MCDDRADAPQPGGRKDVLDPTQPGASWHADPIGPESRLRWWAGDHWTAWVADSPVAEPSIAWTPDIGALPRPIQWGTPVLRVAAAPPLSIRPLPAEPAPAAPAPAAAPVTPAPITPAETPRRRRPRRHALLAAAVVLPLLAAGAASAMLLTPSPRRPRLARAAAFHDPRAGFSLAYPRDWLLDRARPSQGVRFLVDAPGAPPSSRSSVTVATGQDRGPRPSADDLARTVMAGLRPELPGIQLSATTAATLSGGPALQLQLSDPTTSPPTSVQEITGRTSDDRPLTVTVTVHDPRYAPSAAELRDFLASIVS